MLERLTAPRLSPTVVVAIVGCLLVPLATLQYRWLGQVGEAERARLQAGARSRAEQLAQDFDRELTLAFAGLGADAAMLSQDGGPRFAERYQRWAG